LTDFKRDERKLVPDIQIISAEEVEWFIARFINMAGLDWLHVQSALEWQA
jgi:hypothetical protein